MKYYYGNSVKEAYANEPITIKSVETLRQYEENYNVVIPEDEQNEYGLPLCVEYKASELPELNEEELTEDEISDLVGDQLSDDYGFCHNGFDIQIKRNKKGKITKIICSDIDWDVDKEEEE